MNDGTDTNDSGIADNSEIDVELLCGEPYLLWLTIWTDYETSPTERFRKTTRVVDMRTGTFQQTAKGKEGEYGVGPGGRLAGIAENDFPNPDRFYVIGFEWQPSFVRYYARLGGAEMELWKFEDASLVPQRPSKVLLNLWHAPTHWMKGGPANYPAADGTMLVDWVRVWQNQ